MTKKTDIWRWIERGLSLLAIVSMFVAWRVDQAKWKVTVDNLIRNDEKQQTYIDTQNEINGKFLILYDYFIAGGAGTPGTGEEN
jgi:hypothetical protein